MQSPITLSRAQVRELDRRAIEDYGIPGVVLMENAGRGVANRICELGISGEVIIGCGKGNNGGDGFVIARHLQLRGHAVSVWMWTPPKELEGDAKVNFDICSKCGIEINNEAVAEGPQLLSRISDRFSARIAKADWFVDALLGTGVRGAPRSPFDQVIEIVNASEIQTMAVDVPSGLDCDTGEAEVAIRADHTCTFVAAKPGLLKSTAGDHVGELYVTDIGAPRELIEAVRRTVA